jgi:hypothetical protein
MLCNMFVKLALLVFYRLLSSEVGFLRFVTFMMVTAVGFGISSTLVLIFQCQPISKAWDLDEPGKCLSIPDFYYANASIMIASDIVMYLMPMFSIRGLQLRRSKRIVVNILFGLGAL